MTALALKQNFLRAPDAIRRHWRAWIVVAVMLALWVVAGAQLALNPTQFGSMTLKPEAAPTVATELRQAAAATAATQLTQIDPNDAVAYNASIPVSNATNPAARPFRLTFASEADRLRSIDCLTAAIYYEAATEPTDGQRAVAQVVLNRARHPAYPSTVCGVVFQGAQRITGCQFTFSCDGSLRRAPMASYWQRARQVAEAALSGYVYAPVGWATHYHTNWVVPYWASSLTKLGNVGTHIFYRWAGGWGRPPAFTNRHPGREPVIAWRGGFGQPTMAERLAAAQAEGRDAAAAAAAIGPDGVPVVGSVDSFQRAVLRRYEPLRRDTANEMIAQRAGASRMLSRSERWALTGDTTNAPAQRPLGRWGTEQNPAPAAAAPAQPARTPAAAPAPRTPPAEPNQPPADGGGETATATR